MGTRKRSYEKRPGSIAQEEGQHTAARDNREQSDGGVNQ